MRALVQRVREAAVSVDGREIASIGAGLLVFVGIARGDDESDAAALAARVRALRVFVDDQGRTGEGLGDREILCVSQFTLHADTRKGRRPSFGDAAPPEHAGPLYEAFRAALGAKGGEFGAEMSVSLVNEGPMTLLLES